VLNAKRHQRLGQNFKWDNSFNNTSCSTPKGIKGWDSKRENIPAGTVKKCSTPKGIKGWDRLAKEDYRSLSNLCSTPYGIKGWDSQGTGRFLAV